MARRAAPLAAGLLWALAPPASAAPFPGCRGGVLGRCPGAQNCTVKHITQNIDHFNWEPPLGGKATTFRQRYFVAEQWWQPGGPIFFYFGNEDNVELYVNHTGLMWESAEAFGALLVFAEHRYYGESLPFAAGVRGCMGWLTTEQAMADFVYLIDHLQATYGNGARLPVIGFGGSYGGMIAAWFRLKYPQSVNGVIAASAPIWSFAGLDPAYDFNAFNKGVAFDASQAGGSSDRCKSNLKAAWPRILGAGQTVAGGALLSRSFRTCAPVRPRGPDSDDAYDVVQWASEPWAYMAMGNYPYASSYLLHGSSLLPPWPMRVACQLLDEDFSEDESLFAAVREAVAFYYNSSGDKACFDLRQTAGFAGTFRSSPATLARRQARRWQGQHAGSVAAKAVAHAGEDCRGSWDYQWCTEMVQPFTQGTEQDFFFCPNGTYYTAQNCSYWDFEAEAQRCENEWQVRPRKSWARLALGSKDLSSASNIVFSNGLQDPWHGGGVLRSQSESVVAVLIPNGAHHIDLMFSDPEDARYVDIAAARDLERLHIRRWVEEARRKERRPEVLV